MTDTQAQTPPTTNLEAALAYAERGWRVIPIPAGSKHPAIPAWQTAGTTDEARIRHWWTTSPDDGIGIVTGPESGIWVLDVDMAGEKVGDETLRDLTDTYGELPDTYEVITGSGGRHIYFAWPPDVDVRNSASGTLGTDLDVRGRGGQVLAPPTIHPNGNPYEVEASAAVEVADAPGWLLRMLTPDAPERPFTAPTGTPVGDRPGDLWAAQTSWSDLLGADGWTLHHVDRDGEEHWTRPGKDRRDGTSATVGYRGSDVLKVFTSSVPSLRAESTYTKLGYLAAMRFDGDHSAAARHLAQLGYVGAGYDEVDGFDTEPWSEPRPAPAPDPAPEFPVHTLPAWAQAHAVAAADQVQVPTDLTSMLIIGSLSAALTGRARVHASANWSEPVNLYLVTAMRSGSGKSPADKLCVGWLRTWQRQRIEAVRVAHDRAMAKVRHARKKLAKLEGGLGEDADLFAAMDAVEAAEAEVPELPRLLADDATPEAVANLLRVHGERLAIMSTEADLFDMLLKGKPGQRQNVNIYLKAWSGDSFTRDRKGGSETGPEWAELANPLLTVAITVQPSVLAKVQGDDEMVSRGFAARFMFSMPEDLIGYRDQRKRFRSERLATIDAYEAEAAALATRWATWSNPADLRLTPDAAQAVEDFLVEVEPRLAPGEDYERLGEWVNKLHGSIVRYAGLLHLAERNDAAAPVTIDVVARAIDLGRYWLDHAVAVLGLEQERTAEQAQAILTWAAANGARFTTSDLVRGIRRPALGLDRIADYVPALELLIELGWLRPVDGPDWRSTVGVRRSKAPEFALWPECVGKSPSVVISRSPRIASMGECFSPLPPSDTPPTPPITRYANYAISDHGTQPVDNERGGHLDGDPLAAFLPGAS